MNKLLLLCFFFLIFTSTSLEAKIFGKKGKDFEVKEASLEQLLMNQIQSQLQQIDIEKIQKEAFESAFGQAQTPDAITSVNEAKEYRAHYYDPVLVLEEDVVDVHGNLIAKKGDILDPTKELGNPDFGFIFFDGDNPRHLEWALNEDPNLDWILVKGSPFALAEQEDRWVGFDQEGALVQKFEIENVPCRVTPEGKMMLVEEIPIK